MYTDMSNYTGNRSAEKETGSLEELSDPKALGTTASSELVALICK